MCVACMLVWMAYVAKERVLASCIYFKDLITRVSFEGV